MKKIFLMVSMVVFLQAPVWASVYDVSSADSAVEWFATKVTGAHDGQVKIDSGWMEFEDGVLTGGEAVIDMESITVRDIENPTYNEKLETHLKSPDFFDVGVYPKARLKITQVRPGDAGVYALRGDFTIKRTTVSLPFNVLISREGDRVTATTQIELDRTQFDVRYGSGKFFENLGDRMIHDTFKLDISIVASEQ